MNGKDENPYDYPLEADSKPPRKGWKLLEVMVVLAILLVLVGLLIPTSRRAGPHVVNRMVCQNNLHQLSIALLNYNAEYKELPPAYTTDAEGKPLHSWRVLILPYLEQNALYQRIDLSKPMVQYAQLQTIFR